MVGVYNRPHRESMSRIEFVSFLSSNKISVNGSDHSTAIPPFKSPKFKSGRRRSWASPQQLCCKTSQCLEESFCLLQSRNWWLHLFCQTDLHGQSWEWTITGKESTLNALMQSERNMSTPAGLLTYECSSLYLLASHSWWQEKLVEHQFHEPIEQILGLLNGQISDAQNS